MKLITMYVGGALALYFFIYSLIGLNRASGIFADYSEFLIGVAFFIFSLIIWGLGYQM